MDHTICNDAITNSGDDFANPLETMEELSHITTDSNEILIGSPSQTNQNMITAAYQCNLDTSLEATELIDNLSLQDFASSSTWDQFVSVSNENIDPSKEIEYAANCQEWLPNDGPCSFSPNVNNSALQTNIGEPILDSTSPFSGSQSTHTVLNGLTYQLLSTVVCIYYRLYKRARWRRCG